VRWGDVMSAVGIDSRIDFSAAASGPNEISRRLESLPASPYLAARVLLSLGGCFEIYDLFLTGYIAPRLTRSGLLTTRTQSFFGFSGIGAFAVPVIALLGWWLVPLSPYGTDGWRFVVLIGAAASMVIWVLRLYVPESPLWLARHGRNRKTIEIVRVIETASGVDPKAVDTEARPSAIVQKASFSDLFRPRYLSLVVLFVLFNFCQAFGFYGFANWVPTLLTEKGIAVTKSLQYAFIIAFAYPIAPLLAASFADRFERKWIIAGVSVGIIAFGLAFSKLSQPALLIM